MEFFKRIRRAWKRLEVSYLELLDRSRQWGSERKPVPFCGRWPDGSSRVLDGWEPRHSKWTPTQLTLLAIVIGLMVAIAVSTDWQHLWSLMR